MADKNQILSEINEVRDRYSERTVRYAIDMVNECSSDRVIRIEYDRHLSDSQQLENSLRKTIGNRKKGILVKLFSHCGSGKTRFCLCRLPEMFPDGSVILTVPNAIQAEQTSTYSARVNGEEREVVPVTGRSQNDLCVKPGSLYTSVYDCLCHLEEDLENALSGLMEIGKNNFTVPFLFQREHNSHVGSGRDTIANEWYFLTI